MMTRAPKKSETIEVRLPYETKTAFMARCRGEGRTASEAVRAFIDGQIGVSGSRRVKLRAWQAVAAAIAGLTIGAVAAPSLAQTASHARPTFESLDQNHDGALSPAEYAAR